MPQDVSTTAWKIEAKASAGTTFKGYRDLIHETTAIQEFFSSSRGDRFIISAPKGFGKTLLLIAKSKQIEETQGFQIITGSEIVDRPGIGPATYPFRTLDAWTTNSESRQAYHLWIQIWSICIMLAVLKRNEAILQDSLANESLESHIWARRVMASNNLLTTTSIFKDLLHLRQPELEKALLSFHQIEVLFYGIKSQYAIFIDNVDEYFDPLLKDLETIGTKQELVENQKKKTKLWILAQIALVGAAYRFDKINSHVKIFCTIRQEAFGQIDKYDNPAQITGCVTEIEYTHKDFKKIFVKNILATRTRAFPESEDPMVQFFGPIHDQIRHRFVPKDETCFEYVLRHTFLRPRDLMMLGSKLAEIQQDLQNAFLEMEAQGKNSREIEDTLGYHIKRVVQQNSDRVVDDFVCDMKHFFFLPDPTELAPHIQKNVMTQADVELVTKSFLVQSGCVDSGLNKQTEQIEHPFLIWREVGMLGHIRVDTAATTGSLSIQKFAQPTTIKLRDYINPQMTDSYFLIHPALDNTIAAHSPNYLNDRNFESGNIIGYDRPWVQSPVSQFVVHADLHGFSKIMKSEFRTQVLDFMNHETKVIGKDLVYIDRHAGDHIVLISKNGPLLVRSVRDLQTRIATFAEKKLEFRFGGSAGPIEFLHSDRNKLEPSGEALQTSSRLEPKAPAGYLMVDETFYRLIEHDMFDFIPFSDVDVKGFLYNPETQIFTVQKNEGEEPTETRLFGIRLSNVV